MHFKEKNMNKIQKDIYNKFKEDLSNQDNFKKLQEILELFCLYCVDNEDKMLFQKALEDQSVDFRIFGKPFLKPYRRMGVIMAETLDKAKIAARKVSVLSKI